MRRATAPTPTPHALRAGSARWVAAGCAGVLALGIYGLGDTASAKTKAKPTVSIAKVKGLGNVLVNSKHHTLYSLLNNGQPVPCTGACLQVWLPLTVKAGSTPKAGKGVTGLGVVAGGNQVTVNNFPLFMFSGDSKALQANGEGITSFGGTWHAPKVTTSSSGGSKSGGGSNAGTGGVSF